MRIVLKSKVDCTLKKVNDNFDEELFKYLLPPGAKLIEYGGSETGDIVHLKLPLAGTWKSKITDHGRNSGSIYFIDEGVTLPFPLKRWKHKHILNQNENKTIIEDNIAFSTGFLLSDALVYPFLYLAFSPRVKQYKKYFAKF
jgi:ligand-binding SRPBCC domain-containing protein